MAHLNIEFKAVCSNLAMAEEKLKQLAPRFIGTDHQRDTYYRVPKGRLKLREGNIENALIYYERENKAGSKQSDVILFKHEPSPELKEILEKMHGIKTVIEKYRKIYFAENVKFHFDVVKGLGEFIEVEAIDTDGSIGKEKLQHQCDHYAAFFEIRPEDFLSVSYSDM